MFLKNNYEVLWFENNWSGSKCNNNQFTCLQKKRVFNFVNNEIVLEYFKLININLYWSDKIYYLLNIKRKYHLDNITAMLKDYKYTKPVFVVLFLLLIELEKTKIFHLNHYLFHQEKKYLVFLKYKI